jgi:hypothetical protein
MNTTLVIFGAVGAGMIGYGIWSYRKPDSDNEEVIEAEHLPKSLPFRTREVKGVVQAKLSNVSNIWAGNKIYLKNIAKYWREQVGEDGGEQAAQMPVFKHEEINRFYSDIIAQQPIIKGPRKAIITKILEMLDNEGMCPSVVHGDKIKDPDSDFEESTFTKLAKVPLYLHSIAVARKFVSKTSEEILLPNILIAALGHDLGKIPAHHKNYYSTGDHPQISLIILSSIPEYVGLPNRSELDRIIRGHHQMVPSNPLAVALKQCDQEVRNDELGALISRNKPQECVTGMNEDDEEYKKEPDMERTSACVDLAVADPVPEPLTSSEQPEQSVATDHPLGSEPKVQYRPKKVSLPSSLDINALLAAIKKQINQVERGSFGIQWNAISMSNGLVYVKTDGLWQAILEVCPDDTTIRAAEGDEATKRDILYTVVWQLGAKDAVTTEMMGTNYYTIKTSVIGENDKISTWLLIPFRASAFGVLPSDFESTKPAILKKIVKAINLKASAK